MLSSIPIDVDAILKANDNVHTEWNKILPVHIHQAAVKSGRFHHRYFPKAMKFQIVIVLR